MLPRIQDARVWRAVKGLYLGSGLLFLVNISIGILNVFTDGGVPRGQVLAHFHAATIGWVTLSVIATMVWAFTGSRQVSDGYALFTKILSTLGVLAVLGYVTSFWLAFNGTATYALLPTFGIPTALVIWSAFGFAWANLRKQPVLTNAHLLLFGALLVVSVGALMGIIWGLTYSTGIDPYGDGGDGIGSHAGPMDMYLVLAFSAIAETLLVGSHHDRWTKPGMAQMVMGVTAALVFSGGAFAGLFQVAPVALLLFLLSFIFYMVRVGWRTFKVNPFSGGDTPALFFAGLFFPVYLVLFIVAVMVYFIPGEPMPHALEVAFAHVTFIGMATNFLLAQHSAFTVGSAIGRQLEPIGVWTMNLGLVAFIAGEFLGERKEGAMLQALGALISLGVVGYRMWVAKGHEGPREGHAHLVAQE